MISKQLSSVFLLLIATLIGLFSCMSSNPDGFININCGALDNVTDKNGLFWISDSPFTKTRNVFVLQSTDIIHKLQLLTLSYFENLAAKKYCYLIPVKRGLHYLVRASYYRRSTSFLATFFDIIIDGFKWRNVDLSYIDNTMYRYDEIIVAVKSESLSLCLARNSQTEAQRYVFISSIELRPLESSMYNSTDFHKQALVLYGPRTSFGVHKDMEYPDDPFDRMWSNYSASSMRDNNTVDVAPVNNSPQSSGSEFSNKPPGIIFSSAIAKTVVDNLIIPFPYIVEGSYYFALYFCMVNQTKLTQEFAPYINDYEIDFLQFEFPQCIQVNKIIQLPALNYVNLSLKPSSASQLGPFINAAEIYSVLDVPTTTQSGDVFAIRKIAEAINVPDDWTGGDPCLPADYSSTGITCSQDDPPRVIIMNLTNMNLEGAMPINIGDLTALRELLLGNNSLSGQIPDLSSLKNLTILQLQNNKLTGEIPRSLEKLQMLSQLFLQGNKLEGSVSQGLVRPNLDLRVDPQNNVTPDNQKIKSWVIALLIMCPVVLIVCFLSAIFLWRLKHPSEPQSTTDGSIQYQQQSSADEDNPNDIHRLAMEYTEKDIEIAANNYSTLIGRGSFGSVFYGIVLGCEVAIKILETDSNRGESEFQNEKPLDWHTRLNIALQAGAGLLYLHQSCSPPIVHKDIKSSNILLDKRMFAKVADFGLSKLIENFEGNSTVQVNGTIGYLDPEYFTTFSLNEKSDVYSFGVVLLEIISGVSPKDGIVETAQTLLASGKIADLVDSSLGDRYNVESAWKVAEIAYKCLEKESKKRPKMNMVVRELEEAVALACDDNNRSDLVAMASHDTRDMLSLR
ncbi:hypothetical protein SUGI_0372150 [Cryptomeria japonica]|nr:hypothetical protein SUGI_0372150 [Cryptomeria japonica]